MNKGRTLEEVLNFSKTIEYQSEGISSSPMGSVLLFAILAMVLGLFLFLLFGQAFGLVLIVLAVGAFMFSPLAYHGSVASEESEFIKMKEMEWEREYAQPYFRELKVTRTDEVESFSYDYELEREQEKPSHDRQERKDSEKPVYIKMKNGSETLFWAEVIYDPELDADYMEFKYLTAELRFNESRRVYKEAGYQDVKVYTNKP